MDGASLIAQERKRQIEEEGYTAVHDEQHNNEELVEAAGCYIYSYVNRDPQMPLIDWPWDPRDWKSTPEDWIKQLVKAGALIAAEIDRLQRMKGGNSGRNPK